MSALRRAAFVAAVLGWIGGPGVADDGAFRSLTLQERVAAGRAIERIYYSHQVGATRSFEQALPAAQLETEVSMYLKQSAALERYWNTPVTAELLRKEIERMAQSTRMPERLRELYGALDDDSFLVAETLARPVLVRRLTRNFFAYDRTIHAAARQEAVALRDALVEGRISPFSEHANRSVLNLVESDAADEDRGDRTRMDLTTEEFETWRARMPGRVGEVGPLREDGEKLFIQVLLDKSPHALRIATYSVNKRTWDDWWSDVEDGLDAGSVEAVGAGDEPLPAPVGRGTGVWVPEEGTLLATSAAPESTAGTSAVDTWENGSLDVFPEPRQGHTAIWTGSLMIVWGGYLCPSNCIPFNTGFRYDPATDTSSAMSTTNAPSARGGHTAVWTGSLMVVWGGPGMNTGGRYDPLSDTWSPTSTTNAPSARDGHTAVWTDGLMVVWGGLGTNTGGRYDPATDTWTPTSTTGAPTARVGHSAIWTGSLMVVWGGSTDYFATGPGTHFNTGGRYDPTTDTWTPTSMTNVPSVRRYHTATWTGSLMVVWGGDYWDYPPSRHVSLRTGGRYDPVGDTWSPVSTTNPPPARTRHSAVWTGSLVLLWGGQEDSQYFFGSGGRYDPVADTWTLISTTNAPERRRYHTAVWTGSLLLVWGGEGIYGEELDTGGRYDPSTDTWTPMTTGAGGAPSGRTRHTAVWTGSLMIVWGGTNPSSTFLNTGGRYDPATDAWSPTSMTNPIGLYGHTAVWTGNVMIVWGGACGDYGGRYDPLTDTWAPTSRINAPSPSCGGHTAVWTGSEMLVQVGVLPTLAARYDPVSDTWAPMSTVNAPLGGYHTAVWTGHLMLVWGGDTGTGASYDPATDIWEPMSSVNAPQGRRYHTAVWTGNAMVVWGGQSCSSSGCTILSSGGRYDLQTDTWSLTATASAPTFRYDHTAIWTGATMVVWGGTAGLNTGGRYEPLTDTWTPTSTVGAPSGRGLHTAIWTGDSMIVWGGFDGSYSNSGGRYVACDSRLYYADKDGDGHGDPGTSVKSCGPPAGYVENGNDCDDAEAGLWGAPTDVRDLLFLDDLTLGWAAPLDPGATSIFYDALRSADASDFVSAAVCIATDAPGMTATDPPMPDVGRSFFYLIRAENRCPGGQGPLGANSNGNLISGRSCP